MTQKENVSVLRRAAQLLEEFKIAELSEEWIAEQEKQYAGLQVGSAFLEPDLAGTVINLLIRLGMGKYDYQTWTWSPTSDRVYCVDPEAFMVSRMYELLFEGFAAIGQGELSFAEVVQEDDEEKEERRVRFLFNGVPCGFCQKGEFSWDFYCIEAFETVNRALEQQGKTKRLCLVLSDMLCVFYSEPEWAARFAQQSGCMLQLPGVSQ